MVRCDQTRERRGLKLEPIDNKVKIFEDYEAEIFMYTLQNADRVAFRE